MALLPMKNAMCDPPTNFTFCHVAVLCSCRTCGDALLMVMNGSHICNTFSLGSQYSQYSSTIICS